jgi:hypothetical protein
MCRYTHIRYILLILPCGIGRDYIGAKDHTSIRIDVLFNRHDTVSNRSVLLFKQF